MPAYFVNGVFTDNQPAWHGGGIVVEKAALTMPEVFDLVPEIAAPVERIPLFASGATDSGDIVVLDVDDRVANVRVNADGTRSYIATVSPRYVLVQNQATADWAELILQETPGEVAHVKTAGVIGERAESVWFLLDLGGKTVAGEEWRKFLLAGNSFDGSRGQFACLTDVRVVCQNTWNLAISKASRYVSVRHTGDTASRAEEAARVLGLTVDWDKALAELGDHLLTRPVNRPTFETFVKDLLPYDPDAFSQDGNLVERRRHVQNVDDRRFDLTYLWENVPNLDGIRGTAWGALQATIEWQQRYAYPDRKPSARIEATITGTDVNQRALDLLLAV